MADTMKSMELVYADKLNASQLMVGDLIKIDGDLVEVTAIEDDATGDNYSITYTNDYGDEEVHECTYDAIFKLYIYREEEVED
jgi:hypothetical protein